jgi:hypothetical protein
MKLWKQIWNWKIENWKVNHKKIHFSQQIHKKIYFNPKIYYIYFSVFKLEKEKEIHVKITRREKSLIGPLYNSNTHCS